ncbi:phage tail sheath family protein [Burkholderia ambifaria]|uniref:Tail sheath protein C-terminal domain-containing protein n=1 Tax=Burkholderia ambifaria MEX-5 TaxID=396597 RepID=B1T4F6_9BURK|nr:phage tail sheath C-terminal domain-containing protein [Burkholderia ambifaria]EDT41554.1 conserved hypothetical protein [Burkholderia ambifaria MEX-5]
MSDYTVPGVYIEEPFRLALSIPSGATAVPVFALDDGNFDPKQSDGLLGASFPLALAASEAHAFDTWMDVQSIIVIPHGKNDQEVNAVLNHCPVFLALKAYFDNGGGRCYVVQVGKLAEVVPGLDDATLIVQAGAKLEGFGEQVAKLCHVGSTYFALYDGPNASELDATGAATAGDQYVNGAPFAAVYYPWLQASVSGSNDPKVRQLVDVPPSAVMAGVYSTVDRERGVWKAPANVEIRGGLRPKYRVSDAVDGVLNAPHGGKAINVIRSFRGSGVLVWGARTLQSNLDTWRYVPVRRLFCAAERDMRAAMTVAMFEPNSQPTWERVRIAVTNYLHRLWAQGALIGDTPQAAYFAQVGLGVTMSQADVEAGRMIVKVGMAAVRPAEFIVLQLTQDVVPA